MVYMQRTKKDQKAKSSTCNNTLIKNIMEKRINTRQSNNVMNIVMILKQVLVQVPSIIQYNYFDHVIILFLSVKSYVLMFTTIS